MLAILASLPEKNGHTNPWVLLIGIPCILYILKSAVDFFCPKLWRVLWDNLLRKKEARLGIHYLRQMAPELRQALFAEVLGLFYMKGGGNAYTGKTFAAIIKGESVPYRGHHPEALYTDAQGVSHCFEQVREDAFKHSEEMHTWWLEVKLAIHHTSHEQIFAPFKKEIRAMKQHARTPGAP